MKALAVIAGITLCSCLAAQNPGTGHASLVLKDTQRGNRKVPVEIYYPEESGASGINATDPGNDRFPLICFGHGYLLSGIWYQHICDILVPQGYILILPNTESGLFPSHETLGEDMSFALNEISRLGTDSTFFLYGRIDTSMCLMGHSMGGGSLFLGAKMNGNVDAVVGLAALDTRPSSARVAASVTVPTLIFAGGNDCITPVNEHQIPIYNSSASPDKTYIMIIGGTHCQMGVSHPKCIVGEKMARCCAGISEEEQLRILTRYLIPWLGYFLKGESEDGLCFDLTLGSDNTVTYLQSGPLSVAVE